MAGYIPRRFTCSWAVTHPSNNQAQCRLTSLIKPTHQPLHYAAIGCHYPIFVYFVLAGQIPTADLNNFPLGELEETTGTPPVLRGWRLPSRTWNHWTSPWMKQLTWLRIVHSGEWCLRLLALRTHGGAYCMPEMNEWMKYLHTCIHTCI